MKKHRTSLYSMLAVAVFMPAVAAAAPLSESAEAEKTQAQAQAHAADAVEGGAPKTPDFTITANVTLISDFRVRGVSYTSRGPALQGGFDLAHSSGFYIGNINSNISYFSDAGLGSSSLELDVYGGYRVQIGGNALLDVGVIHYHYPGRFNPRVTKPHTTEAYASASVGPVSAKLSYSLGNYYGVPRSDGTYYAELNVTHVIPGPKITLSGHLGTTKVDGPGNEVLDYEDWSIGASKEVGSGLSAGLSYVDSNANRVLYTDSRGRYLGKAGAVFYLRKSF